MQTKSTISGVITGFVYTLKQKQHTVDITLFLTKKFKLFFNYKKKTF